MGAILFASMVLSAPPASDGQPVADRGTYEQPAERTLAQWREEVRLALRGQATAKPLDQPAAVVKLLNLYNELGKETRLSRSEHKQFCASIRNRLIRLREEIPVDLKLRLAKVEAVTQRARAQNKPELLDKIKDDQAVLAEWKGVLAQQLPGVAGNAAIGNNAAANNADDGRVLVDLIQAIVTPDVWTANGGPSAIVYFPNTNALVVSATTETHEDIANLLDALRRAGN